MAKTPAMQSHSPAAPKRIAMTSPMRMTPSQAVDQAHDVEAFAEIVHERVEERADRKERDGHGEYDHRARDRSLAICNHVDLLARLVAISDGWDGARGRAPSRRGGVSPPVFTNPAAARSGSAF